MKSQEYEKYEATKVAPPPTTSRLNIGQVNSQNIN